MKMKTQKTTHRVKQNFNWILTGLVLSGLLSAASMSARGAEIWTEKAPMPTPRLALAASVVDGKIYAIGGRAERTLTTEYDPATDTWTTKTPMITPRFCLATSVVDGKIYAIGGSQHTSARAPGVATEEYDPVTDAWTKRTDMPTGRWGLSTSVVDGKVYAIGGSEPTGWKTYLRTVEEYDPLTDTWTKKADMPTARAWHSASVVDGKIYVIGGALVYTTMLSTVEMYDPATDTWTTKTPMPTARPYHTTAVVNGIIYAIGGGTHTPSRGFSVVEAYDPATDIWTTKAEMPAPTCYHSTSVVDGRIYAFGGSPSGYQLDHPGFRAVYEYDPAFLFVDFNGDGIVDGKDVLIMTAHWGQDYPPCDIGPTRFGDGVVDVQDVVVLAEHIGKKVDDPTLLTHWAFDETEGPVAYDSAGRSDATVIGVPQWQPAGGAVDGALEFDGATLVVAGSVLNPSDGPFSVFAWVKGGAAGQAIISQVGDANWLMADASGVLMTELKSASRLATPLCSDTVVTDG
ncbi:MAG: Kelch repeat-containing protein, partial [Planctomycetota bacterium]